MMKLVIDEDYWRSHIHSGMSSLSLPSGPSIALFDPGVLDQRNHEQSYTHI